MSYDTDLGIFEDFEGFESGVNTGSIVPSRYVVAIYELDRHYGGPEEGGWWYNTGNLRRVLKIFRNKDAAYTYAGRCNHWLEKVSKAGGFRADLSSMAYEGGYYSASVHGETAPKDWSDYQPYE